MSNNSSWIDELVESQRLTMHRDTLVLERFVFEMRIRKGTARRIWTALRSTMDNLCTGLNAENNVWFMDSRGADSFGVSCDKGTNPTKRLIFEFSEESFRVFVSCGDKKNSYFFHVYSDTFVELSTYSTDRSSAVIPVYFSDLCKEWLEVLVR